MGPILGLLAVCTVAVVARVHRPQEAQLAAFFLPILTVWYLQSRSANDSRLSWQVPTVGYAMTFAIGAGLSLSNQDLRTDVELVGAIGLAVVTGFGIVHWYKGVRARPHARSPQWKRDVIAGLVCNLLLAWTGSSLAVASYGAKHKPIPVVSFAKPPSAMAQRTAHPNAVWIDTDPACGAGATADVDDCWALVAASRSPELAIRGISTVFGNREGHEVHRVLEEVLARLSHGRQPGDSLSHLHAGSIVRRDAAGRPTAASRALAEALEREPLTVIALGPLTNIAALLDHRPDLTGRIERIVLVGGKRPGQLFHPGHQWWFHFGDFNIAQDPESAETVLYSGVPVTLVPFDLATKLVVTHADLERLRDGDGAAKWLSDVSEPWLAFWNTILGRPGFHPFDVLAVAYAAIPEHFHCRRSPARIGFNLFLEPFGMGRDLEVSKDLIGPIVTDCYDLDREVKDVVLTRILGNSDGADDVS
ncbi:MAG: nucleoside hydrolase [Nitrospiraceae bacterium]